MASSRHQLFSLSRRLIGVVPSITLTATAAVDTITSKDAPEPTCVQAKIKSKDDQGALVEPKAMAVTNQHADVYSPLGFSLRKTGDDTTALIYYKQALDFDADNKGAREAWASSMWR